jgi:hypothetical protein
MMRIVRTGLGLMILITTTIGLSSCTAPATPIPTVSDLSGRWSHKSGSSIAALVLEADNTFSISNVPAGVVRGDDSKSGRIPRDEPVSLTGTWTIGSESGQKIDANGEPFIELGLEPNAYSTGIGLEVRKVGKSTRLSIELGDPDHPLTYDFVR